MSGSQVFPHLGSDFFGNDFYCQTTVPFSDEKRQKFWVVYQGLPIQRVLERVSLCRGGVICLYSPRLSVVVHTYYISTQEADARESELSKQRLLIGFPAGKT